MKYIVTVNQEYLNMLAEQNHWDFQQRMDEYENMLQNISDFIHGNKWHVMTNTLFYCDKDKKFHKSAVITPLPTTLNHIVKHKGKKRRI